MSHLWRVLAARHPSSLPSSSCDHCDDKHTCFHNLRCLLALFPYDNLLCRLHQNSLQTRLSSRYAEGEVQGALKAELKAQSRLKCQRSVAMRFRHTELTFQPAVCNQRPSSSFLVHSYVPISQMAITFGSFGDIIAAVQVAYVLIEVFNSQRGVKREFRELLVDLRLFHRYLEQVRSPEPILVMILGPI